MTPEAALIELLERVGAGRGKAVLISEHELGQWASAAVSAMKTLGLLTKASPASSAVCPGCERECVMSVHTLPSKSRSDLVSFIVCDKRTDINRVTVPVARLEQWRCTVDAVCGFIAASLRLRRSDKHRPASAGILEIGMANGNKRNQMLCLQIDGELMLLAGGNKAPLIEFLAFGKDTYSVDGAMVGRLVDASTTLDNRHTPSSAKRESRKLDTQAMYKDWQKAYRELIKRQPNKSKTWCSQQIAKMPIARGRDASTIKKHMLS